MPLADATTVRELLAFREAEQPEAPAIVDGEARWTNRELATMVDAVARGLLAAGVEPGDRVATLAPPRPTSGSRSWPPPQSVRSGRA